MSWGDEDDRRPAGLPDVEEVVLLFILRQLIERRERLIEQQHRRLVGESPGERHPLGHPAGEAPRSVFLEAREPHRFDQVVDPLGGARIVTIDASRETDRDVLADGRPREQSWLLKDHADVVAAAVANVGATDLDAAREVLLEPTQHAEQGRFSTS